MAGRIRSLKPEWLENERLSGCSSDARLLSVALILLADDYGRGRASIGYLAGQVWSQEYSRDPREVTSKALEELASIEYVVVYQIDGQTYFALPGWDRHQRVDKPGKPRVPGPDDPRASRIFATFRELPAKVPETLAPDVSDPLAPDHDHDHEREEEGEREESAPSALALPLGLPGAVKGEKTGGGEVPLHGTPKQAHVAADAPGLARARKRTRRAPPITAEQREIAARVIRELVRVSGFSYEPEADGNVEKVVEQLVAGRAEADLLAVVRDRAKDWGGDEKCRRWLRPETLFGPKFGTYLAQAKVSDGGTLGSADRELEDARRRAAERSRERPAFDEPLAGGSR